MARSVYGRMNVAGAGGGADITKLLETLFGKGDTDTTAITQQNRYERLYQQKVGAIQGNYDVKLLDEAYDRGEKFRSDVIAGRYKMQDKEIFLETIEANQANLNRYRSGVQDYNAQSATYKDTSNQIADLTKQLSALDMSGVDTDFDKARNVSKQITGLIGDQVQIFSNLSTKYSTRLNTDTPLKDYMSNIRVSNKYLIDFMSDDYLSAWETELYGRANESYDYRKLEQGVSAMDSMKQSFMGDEQEKIQTLHQSLKSIYSSFSTGMDKDGVELDDVARRELGKQSLVLQDSLKSSLKLFEENTGNADLGLYLNDPRMSPWLAEEEPPTPSPPSDDKEKTEKEVSLNFEEQQLEDLESNENKLDSAVKAQLALKSELKTMNESTELGYEVDPSSIKEVKQKLTDTSKEISSLKEEVATPRLYEKSWKSMKAIKGYAKRILIDRGFATAENVDDYILKNEANWNAAIRQAKNQLRKGSAEYEQAPYRQKPGTVPAYLKGDRAPKP